MDLEADQTTLARFILSRENGAKVSKNKAFIHLTFACRFYAVYLVHNQGIMISGRNT